MVTSVQTGLGLSGEDSSSQLLWCSASGHHPDPINFMSHFLFIAGALRERTSQESAELQFGAGIWGLCTALIRDNLQKFLAPDSHGLVYVLKEGIRAEFAITSPVQPFQALDELLKDEVRTEARYGFVRITPLRRWQVHAPDCQALLQRVLGIEEQAELTRRLSLGMHRLTDAEFRAIVEGLGVEA